MFCVSILIYAKHHANITQMNYFFSDLYSDLKGNIILPRAVDGLEG